MAAEEVKAFPTLTEVHDPRLVRMQLEPESGKDLPRSLKRLPCLALEESTTR